jgi:hypothetical protein
MTVYRRDSKQWVRAGKQRAIGRCVDKDTGQKGPFMPKRRVSRLAMKVMMMFWRWEFVGFDLVR